MTISYPSAWSSEADNDGEGCILTDPSGNQCHISCSEYTIDMASSDTQTLGMFDAFENFMGGFDSTGKSEIFRSAITRADAEGILSGSADVMYELNDELNAGKLCVAYDGTSAYVLIASVAKTSSIASSYLATVESMWSSVTVVAPVAAPAAAFDPNNYLDPGYEALARTPDDFTDKKVYVGGKVLQVSESKDGVMLRVATDYSYDGVVMVAAPTAALGDTRILEDDLVDCYGTSTGIYTYTSVLGASVSVPSIYADKVLLQ